MGVKLSCSDQFSKQTLSLFVKYSPSISSLSKSSLRDNVHATNPYVYVSGEYLSSGMTVVQQSGDLIAESDMVEYLNTGYVKIEIEGDFFHATDQVQVKISLKATQNLLQVYTQQLIFYLLP